MRVEVKIQRELGMMLNGLNIKGKDLKLTNLAVTIKDF